MLSLIIPTISLDDFLYDTVSKYKMIKNKNFEIIIVYDKKKIKQYEKFSNVVKGNPKLKLIQNTSRGRINALNLGYVNSVGDIIKCIDADDILLPQFFDELNQMAKYPAHCHNARLIDEYHKKVGSYTFEKSILFKNYEFVLSNLKSAPRWAWSFNRKIAENIFPIPPDLFAEDIWFCLKIKKFTKNIFHINKELYLYKQHSNSEWGGIANFDERIMRTRAKWILQFIPVLISHKRELGIKSENLFLEITNYYKVFLSKKNFYTIICAQTNVFYKLKLTIILYFPSFASKLLNIKWFLTKYFLMLKTLF